MATYVTLSQGKAHLRITHDDDDSDIALKVDQAEAAVLDRINSTAHWRAISVTWTDVTIPPAVQAAMLIVLTHLSENRGDDMAADALLWAAVDALIWLHKDPVLA